MSENIYRQLQQRLDLYSMGYPATESGIELQILKYLFSESDAKMFLSLSQNPGGMCNCCGDCCGVLRALNRHPKPTELVFSNHMAIVEKDECTGCQICLERCQMNALKINDEEVAEVDTDRCIGCGLCVTSCDMDTIILKPKHETVYQVPPLNTAEQMMLMAQKRGLI